MEKSWKILKSDKLILRKPEPEDLEFLYAIENNSDFWFVSDTKTPFSRWQIKEHIANSVYDIYTIKELRLIIESKTEKKQFGIVDLFDFDPFNLRAGIGVVICNEYQNTNIATEAIQLVINYAFKILELRQLWCYIDEDNLSSIKLFEDKLSFKKSGTLKEWKKYGHKFIDVYFFQIINNSVEP